MGKKLTKHETTGELKAVKSLYELVGIASHSYGTTDKDEYEEKLNSMNMADLHDHAVQHGIVPSDNRERLTDLLVTKFLSEMGHLQAAMANKDEEEPKKMTKRVKDILSRGK